MKRFEFAIKAINDEILRCVGKVAVDYYDKKVPMDLAVKTQKVENLKRAIKILENHEDNKNV